jgi:membrane-bound lytic murein transglycosylase D
MDLRTTGQLAACGVIVLSTLACGSTGTGARAAGVRVVSEEAVASRPVEPVGSIPADQVPDPMPELAELGTPTPPDGPEAPPSDPSALLVESLDAFESATALWQEGAVDEALSVLDRAYELMASAEPDDATQAQEKENLRHLIGRRVVEIYASRQTAVGDMDRSIPRVLNDEVRREIASFTGREREFFLESYRRSGRYRGMIVEELRAAGMPEQLSWLPLVESGFKSRALSTARALGLWQFIPSTGYRYGLERDTWIDERMDPEKATRAAIGYLTDLHELFGDWLTALAAYNCGENAVLRHIRSQPVAYFDQFWDLYERLPRETRRYVPRFLAVLAILEDPAAYGIELPEPYPPFDAETVRVARAADLSTLEQASGTTPGLLADLNPELRMKATPEAGSALRVPAGSGETVLASLEALPAHAPPQPEEVTHRVSSGDSLWALASRYGTSIDRIRRDNGLSGNVLRPGQTLVVRPGDRSAPVEAVYTVRRGDTLGAIARRQGVPLSRLLRANSLSSRSVIHPGQRIRIPR